MRFVTSSILVLSLAPTLVAAQGKRASPTEPANRAPARVQTTHAEAEVPKDMIPPAGKCRIWMRGVPAAQQPAPTDCTTALRQAPSNGILVFGPALRDLSPFEARRSELRTQQAERRTATREGRDSGGRANDTATEQRPTTATQRGTNATARDSNERDTKSRETKAREPETRPPTSSGASQRRPTQPPPAPRRPDRPE